MKNFNELLNDPSFQIGASIIGNTGQPGVVGAALSNMANVNRMKQEAEAQRRRAEIEQQNANQTGAYQQGELADRAAQRDIQTKQYERQNAQTQQQIEMEQRKMALQSAIMKSLAPQLGFDPSAFGADAGGQPPQQAAPQPLLQGGPVPPQAMPAPGQPDNGAPPLTITPMLPGGSHIEPLQNFNQSGPNPAGRRRGTPNYLNNAGALSGTPGTFGTPSSLLDSLMHVESGGNPLAINPTSGAMGPYQFMPGTVDMLRRQGMPFNPFDKVQARNAADFYLSQLVSKNGGNWQKALADYGGFKDKDPTAYVAKVMSGVAPAPSPMAGMQNTPTPNKGIDMGRVGAMMALGGMPGGNTLVQLGQMMKPENVPAGGWTRDPGTGQTTFNPDPYKEQDQQMAQQRLGLDTQRFGLESQKAQADAQKAQLAAQEQSRKMTKEQAADTMSYQNITSKFDSVAHLADKLLKDPGLKYNSGYYGAVGLGSVPGLGRDTKVNLDQMKSKLKVDILTELKAASANGSSGFGQLSEREGQTLETYWANLDKAQSEEQLKSALADIKQWANQAQHRYTQQYRTVYGKLPSNEDAAAAAAAPQAPQGGAMTLDEYIAKHANGR